MACELASDPLQELIATNLHDALVREWQFDGEEFRWSLIIGDLQVGYELLTVVYLDAMLIGTTPAELTEFDLCDRRHELVSDEVDFADIGRGRLDHRFEFSPEFLFAVQFSDVRITREPLAERA